MAAMGPVHILGAGSIGLLFSEALFSRGIPCTLLLRNQAKLAALTALQGKVTLEQPHAGSSRVSHHRVAGEVAAQLPLDCSGTGLTSSEHAKIKRLIVTTKANHAVPALAAIKHRLSSDSVVLLLTNGVLGVYMDAVRTLFPPGDEAAHYPAFLLGMTTHGAYRKEGLDFHVVHAGHGNFVAGMPSDDLTAAAAAAQAHSSSSSNSSFMPKQAWSESQQPAEQQQQQQSQAGHGTATEQQQRLRQQQYHNMQEMLALLGSLQQLQPNTSVTPEQLQQQLLLKLVINCCSNPMSGLLHCRNGGLPGNPDAEVVWRHVIAECKAVFGAKLPGSEQELFDKVSHVVQINASNYNSMLQDVIKRVPTEIDFLNGFVVKQGAAVGVATPWNQMLVLLVRARQAVPHELLTSEAM